jgi:hypothetical protein
MLRCCATLFWDFDGVMKESVAVKSDAYSACSRRSALKWRCAYVYTSTTEVGSPTVR